MRKDLYQPLWQSILVGVLLIIGGIIACIHPLTAVVTLAVLLGILVVIRGLLLVAEFFQLRKINKSGWSTWLSLVLAILLVILGIYLLLNPGFSIFLVAQLAAIGFIADAIHSISLSYWIRPFSFGLWLCIVILNVFLLISGIILMINWIAASEVVALMLSIDLIVSGVTNILTGIFNKKKQ